MAQFLGPRHKLYQAELPRVVEVPAAPVEPVEATVDEAAATTVDRGWFDSSWELRKGLDVAELSAAPVDPSAAGQVG